MSMKRSSFTASEQFIGLLELAAKEFNMKKSKLIRNVFKHFKFLYNFMNEYMEPNNKVPLKKDLKKIELIGELVKWL